MSLSFAGVERHSCSGPCQSINLTEGNFGDRSSAIVAIDLITWGETNTTTTVLCAYFRHQLSHFNYCQHTSLALMVKLLGVECIDQTDWATLEDKELKSLPSDLIMIYESSKLFRPKRNA